MLKKLLGSKTRVSILKIFIFNPYEEYYIRQISRLTGQPFEPVRRELIQLESIGLVKSRLSGKQKYYSINTKHVLYPDFKSIILKTVGIGDILQYSLKDRNDIAFAFIYGSYAKNTEHLESDIDLFIIGDIPSKKLQEVLSDVENQTKRELNPTVYSPKEFKEKYKAKNHFILSLFKGPKIFLKGDENGLRRLVSGR